MTVIGIVFTYIVLQMVGVWVVSRCLNNPSVVDVSWSIGLMLSGLIYLGSAGITARNLVVAGLLILWALRLASYIGLTRIRHGHVDKRYVKLSHHWLNPSLGFFLNFQLQGLLIFIISLIFYWISHASNTALTRIDALAIVLVILGIIGESVADLQLYQFKRKQQGAVCDVGLWFYSRHPNYFFDWLTWVGFTVFGFQSPRGYLSIISLGVLYGIFNHITGPMTEESSIASRGQQYLDYQKTTSMFFPWFK